MPRRFPASRATRAPRPVLIERLTDAPEVTAAARAAVEIIERVVVVVVIVALSSRVDRRTLARANVASVDGDDVALEKHLTAGIGRPIRTASILTP